MREFDPSAPLPVKHPPVKSEAYKCTLRERCCLMIFFFISSQNSGKRIKCQVSPDRFLPEDLAYFSLLPALKTWTNEKEKNYVVPLYHYAVPQSIPSILFRTGRSDNRIFPLPFMFWKKTGNHGSSTAGLYPGNIISILYRLFPCLFIAGTG